MEKKVMTVTGPVLPDSLGTTLIHEHFTFAYPGWYADDSINPYNRDKKEVIDGILVDNPRRFLGGT